MEGAVAVGEEPADDALVKEMGSIKASMLLTPCGRRKGHAGRADTDEDIFCRARLSCKGFLGDFWGEGVLKSDCDLVASHVSKFDSSSFYLAKVSCDSITSPSFLSLVFFVILRTRILGVEDNKVEGRFAAAE